MLKKIASSIEQTIIRANIKKNFYYSFSKVEKKIEYLVIKGELINDIFQLIRVVTLGNR